MQLTDHQQKMLEGINATLGHVPITKGMGGITFHSVGLVHVHIGSDLVVPTTIELALWTHEPSDRIQWLKDFVARLTEKETEGKIADEDLKPDPAHQGGFHVSIDATRLYDQTGHLQLVRKG